MADYSKRYFRLAYTFTIAALAVVVLQMTKVMISGPLGTVLSIGLIAAAVIVAAYGFRSETSGLEIPEQHTPQHYFAVLSHSLQTALISFGLHGAFYALFWFAIPLFETGDEPVFFIILLFVVPAGLIAGAVGRAWDWAVVRTLKEMKEQDIALPPHSGRYYAPFASYAWLWKYSKGVSALTGRRIPAGGTFCAVFFLGVVGFFIIRRATDYHLKRMAGTQSVTGRQSNLDLSSAVRRG